MKNIFKIAFLASALIFFTGCDTVELELLDNPNVVGGENADVNFILNDVQLTFGNTIFSGYNGPSQSLTRLSNLFGAYNGAIDENTLDFTTGEWFNSYQMFGNIDIIEGLHNSDLENGGEGFANHLGVAQVFEAFAYMLLVDYVNNVPFSEANQPEDFPNPNPESGKSVYDAQLELLDAAIANLNSGGLVNPDTDLYFGTYDPSNWVAVANTLKIRAYVNLRLTEPARAVSGINAVVNSGNFINASSKDFQFAYSNVQDPVESRHPFFVAGYGAGGAGGYMSNGLLDMLNAGDDQPPFIETGDIDPRTRYYLFRQDANAPSGSNLPCAGDGSYEYCYVGNLYWGRDHTDEAGIPNDGFKRTTFGIYPGGGAFDRDEFVQARAAENSLEGAGIAPILTASNTHFLLAEAALMAGSNGNPASLLEDGVRISLDKVDAFSTVDEGGLGMTAADKNDYVSRVMQEYNNANNNGKMAIIARESYLASFGNGVEAYNLYRRTGLPELQSPIIAAGPFPRGFRYPASETENNPNVQQRQLTDQVFWDNNPGGFID